MKTVQMTIDESLLSAVDAAAVAGGQTRSAFIRLALQAEVKRRHDLHLENAHRQSHLEQPDTDAPIPRRRAWGD